MRAVRWCLFQSAADDLRDLLVADLARSPGARVIVETVQPALRKATTPLAHRVRVGAQPSHDHLVVQPLGRRQHNPGPPRQSLGRLPAAGQACQLTPLRFRQDDRHCWPAHEPYLHQMWPILSNKLLDQDTSAEIDSPRIAFMPAWSEWPRPTKRNLPRNPDRRNTRLTIYGILVHHGLLTF